MAAATIPLVGTTYDTDALHDTLLKWKESYDLSTSIVVMAEDDIEYQAVVDAMDAIRMHEAAWLFPDVLFATLVAGGG